MDLEAPLGANNLDASNPESATERPSGPPNEITTTEPAILGNCTTSAKHRNTATSASIVRRGIAYLIDIMIINVFIYWRTSGYQGGITHDKSLIIVPAIYFLLYFPILEGTFLNATVGKALVGIKIVDQHGAQIRIVRAYSRHLCKFMTGIPSLFLSWFFAGLHPKGLAIHDILVKTQVVRRTSR